MIGGMMLANWRMDQLVVSTRPGFRHSGGLKSHPLSSFGQNGAKRRSIVAREIEARVVAAKKEGARCCNVRRPATENGGIIQKVDRREQLGGFFHHREGELPPGTSLA
jgi:hypothetical protein